MPDVKPKRLDAEEFRAIYEMGVIAKHFNGSPTGQIYGRDVYVLLGHVAALEAELAEAKRDTERMNWLFNNPVFVAYSRDGDDCWLHWAYDPRDEEGEPFNGPVFGSPREAIDAAIAQSKEPK